MKLCPNCGMQVEQGECCPYCKTALSVKDEKAFHKDYTADLIKTVWLSVLSFVAAVVSLLLWSDALKSVSVHALSFAVISLVMALVQFRSFGIYSRRFHTSNALRITVIVIKYACAVIALFIAVCPLIMMIG